MQLQQYFRGMGIVLPGVGRRARDLGTMRPFSLSAFFVLNRATDRQKSPRPSASASAQQ